MGRKRDTESVASVLLAFLDHRTWKQADLARHVGVERKQIVKILGDLHDAGLPLDREEEHPHVYWSVPSSWFPGAVAFRGEDVGELVRVLQLCPQSPKRDRLLEQITSSVTGIGPITAGSVMTRTITPAEEGRLAALQHAASIREPISAHYYTLSRGDLAWRYLSVHRLLIDQGRFIATCHRDGRLKWFRLDGVVAVGQADGETFRSADEEDIRCLLEESVDGYHSGAAPVTCVFRVRHQDARWIRAQLPLSCEVEEEAEETVFRAKTSGLIPLARFLVGLGSAVHVESFELRTIVNELARGALAASESVRKDE